MNVNDILTLISRSASLDKAEILSMEEAYSEAICLKIIIKLGEELSEKQKEEFRNIAADAYEQQNPQKLVDLLKSVGFNESKAINYLETCMKDVLVEMVNALDDRISESKKIDILSLIN